MRRHAHTISQLRCGFNEGIRQRAKRAFSTQSVDVDAKRRRYKCAAAEGGIRHSATWLLKELDASSASFQAGSEN